MNKKIFLIVSLICLIIGGLLLYFLFSKKQGSISNQSIVRIGVVKIEKVSREDRETKFPILSQNGDFIFYFNRQEKPGLFSYDLKGKKVKQFAEGLDDVDNIFWSPDLTKAIFLITNNNEKFAKYNSPFFRPDISDNYPMYWFYELKDKKFVLLDINIRNLTWSPDSQKIAYQYINPDQNINKISTANPDGGNWQDIITLEKNLSSVEFSSDSKKLILLIQDVDDFSSISSVSVLEIDNKKLFRIPNTEGTISVKISKNSQKIIFNKLDANGLSGLWVTNLEGKNQKDLKLNALTIKIAWLDDQTVIAAVSQDENQSDKFYKINIDTGEKTEIPYDSGGAQIDAQNLMPTKDGKTLYFTSDDLLYRIDIGTGNQ